MASDKLSQNFFERHADKIEYGAPSGCWLWTASTRGKGYGTVWVRGKKRYAHREAYEAVHGAGSANGLIVRHRCDTPLCVNPAHLVIGTVADNNRDMAERGRQVTPKGTAHGRAKLTDDDVRAIRAEYVRGSSMHGLRGLARKYGVHRSVIGRIVNRKLWVHM